MSDTLGDAQVSTVSHKLTTSHCSIKAGHDVESSVGGLTSRACTASFMSLFGSVGLQSFETTLSVSEVCVLLGNTPQGKLASSGYPNDSLKHMSVAVVKF